MTTITFYADPDGQVWATGSDDEGEFALRQINPDDFRSILATGQVTREGADKSFVTHPADLVAIPFGWLDGVCGDLVLAASALQVPGVARFLFGSEFIATVRLEGRAFA